MSATIVSGSAHNIFNPAHLQGFLPAVLPAMPQTFGATAAMGALDFAAAARIGAILPATTVSGGVAAASPAVAGGSAAQLIGVAASLGGGVHVYTHVS